MSLDTHQEFIKAKYKFYTSGKRINTIKRFMSVESVNCLVVISRSTILRNTLASSILEVKYCEKCAVSNLSFSTVVGHLADGSLLISSSSTHTQHLYYVKPGPTYLCQLFDLRTENTLSACLSISHGFL